MVATTLPVFPDRVTRGACPTFFRACCSEASCGRTRDGAKVGYDHPAFHLTIHLPAPDEIEPEDWEKAQDELIGFIDERDDVKVIDWFCRWFPRCMAFVPRRRRAMFLRGVYQAAVYNGWIDNLDE